MRIFHKKAFDGYVATTVYSDFSLNEAMGKVDMIHVAGYSTQVTGTTPTLSINWEHSIDQVYWSSYYGPPPVSLSTSQETLFQNEAPEPNLYAKAPYLRLKFSLGGTNPQGYFRIWVTGRDFSRRAKSMMQVVGEMTDPAHHAM